MKRLARDLSFNYINDHFSTWKLVKIYKNKPPPKLPETSPETSLPPKLPRTKTDNTALIAIKRKHHPRSFESYIHRQGPLERSKFGNMNQMSNGGASGGESGVCE